MAALSTEEKQSLRQLMERALGTAPVTTSSSTSFQLLKISADATSVCTSSALILAPEFAESRFRKAYDEMTAERMDDAASLAASLEGTDTKAVAPASSSADDAEDRKDDGTDDGKPAPLARSDAISGDLPVIEMRFDRNGRALQTIVDAMRGYDVTDSVAAMNKCDKKHFFADLDYYRLPSIAAIFKEESGGGAEVDLTRTDTLKVNYIEATKTFKHVHSANAWLSIAMKGLLESGKRTVEYEIVNTNANKHLMFGVMPPKLFKTNAHCGGALCPSWYATSTGHFYFKGSARPMPCAIKNGDRVSVTATIDADREHGTITFAKNGEQFGTAPLEDQIDITEGVIFVVSIYTPEDAIKVL
jgi:hypothetical protein